MMMRKTIISACLLSSAFFVACGEAPKKSKPDMKSMIEENFRHAAAQYKILASKIPADRMPKYYDPRKDSMITSDTKWWCSGFYPGTLWYIYEQTRDEAIKKEAEARLALLEPEKHFTGNHDLGFMIFCSFGNAYRITGNALYKPTIDTAAMSLATRYRPEIKSIQSWDKNKHFNCPVIIDNMMNLELLHWVSDQGGDSLFRNIAISHANSTLERHYRPDNSSWHVLDYDLTTGQVIGKRTWQGAADSSAWARGQSWGLYGFTVMYRMTKDDRYLQQAQKIADFILSHPRLPEDMVPYWDFDAPDIPNTFRDASAAAVNASALLELAQYSDNELKARYLNAAEKMLITLSSDAYRAKEGENGGFILMHSLGALPFNGEVDVPLTYADYYFLEALKRYKDWYLK
jgi:unsaturated chondroitin disaccharide hydrolase